MGKKSYADDPYAAYRRPAPDAQETDYVGVPPEDRYAATRRSTPPVVYVPAPEEPPAPGKEPAGEADERAPEEPVTPYWTGDADQPEIIATNANVRLTCTLAAMLGLFALFLVFNEKRSRAVHRYAVQSAGLTAAHLIGALLLLAAGAAFSPVPYAGVVVTLVCWIFYIILVIVTVWTRVRMMSDAWRGWRHELPGLGRILEKYC